MRADGLTQLSETARESIVSSLQAEGYQSPVITAVKGDASGRRYWRASEGDRSVIIMHSPQQPQELCHPGDSDTVRIAKGYDASVRRNRFDLSAYEDVQSLLKRLGVRVPDVLASDRSARVALIEDVGALTLEGAVKAGMSQRALLEGALSSLHRLSAAGTFPSLGAMSDLPPSVMPMDQLALETEANLFTRFFLPWRVGRPLEPDEDGAFREVVSALCHRLKPECLVLRDFHSPNIMVTTGWGRRDLVILDFQDTLIGDSFYDLASLLDDARMDVPAYERQRILEGWGEATSVCSEEAEYRCSVASIQRNMKIAGEFVRFHTVGNDSYLHHLPRISRYIEQCISVIDAPDFRVVLRDILGSKRIAL